MNRQRGPQPMDAENDKPDGFLETFLDAEGTDGYRLLFKKNPLPMWVFDCKTLAFLAVNEAAIRQYGYSREEFLRQTILDIRPPAEAARLLEHLGTLPPDFGATGAFVSGEWLHRRKDGSILVVDITGSRITFMGRQAHLVLAHEITERKQTEERSRFQADVLAQVNDAVVAVDMQGRVTYWNQGAERLYGYASAEALGSSTQEVFRYRWFEGGSDDAVLASLLATGAWRGELIHQTRSGEEIVVEASVSWYRNASGVPTGSLTIIRDVSARRRVEDSLRVSEALNRSILEAMPGGIVKVAPDGSIFQANAEAQRILGLKWDQLTCRFVSDFAGETFWEDGRPCPVAEYPVSKCLRTGQPQPAATIGVRRPDQQTFWSMFTAVPLLDGSAGPPRGAVVTFLDITDRKRAEQALRESEERHRVISELTSDYAYTCRVNADGTIDLDSITAGFTRVTGYELDELIALGGWSYLIHPDDRAEAARISRELLCGERSVHELRIRTKGGDTRWIRYSTQPTWDSAQGRVTRLVGAVQDITASKQAEEKLRDYTQRLRTLSRRLLEVQELERRHLARELHDEIGQVLTGLKLSLEMSTRRLADSLGPHLQQAQELLKDLTTRVRDLSLRLRPTMLDDLGLIPALLWLFERYTAQTRIRVAFEHDGRERRFPMAVETASYRIVQEALTNVARHAGVDQATVRLWFDDHMLHIQIEDRGRGFEPASLPTQSESSGLSGMHERAILLGGMLEVEARPGAGTRLTADLPLPEIS